MRFGGVFALGDDARDPELTYLPVLLRALPLGTDHPDGLLVKYQMQTERERAGVAGRSDGKGKLTCTCGEH